MWLFKDQLRRTSLLLTCFAVLWVAGCAQVHQPRSSGLYTSLASSTNRLNVPLAQNIINAYRAENKLSPLRLDPSLTSFAKSHAHDMANHDKISHKLSRGNFKQRMQRANLVQQAAVENIAAGQDNIASAFSGWRSSPAHNKNLLNPEMNAMGIAAVYAPGTRYKVFWTLVLAKR